MEPREAERETRAAFAPRDERAMDGMARWMGLLGRLRVLAGGILMLLVVGAAVAYATTEALLRPSSAADVSPPLIRLGALSTQTLARLGASLFVVGALVLRGGVLLDRAGEDFERIVHDPASTPAHLATALRRTRAFFRVEAALALGALALAGAWALGVWP